MYEIWSLGHKPFENYTNNEVSAVAKIETECGLYKISLDS